MNTRLLEHVEETLLMGPGPSCVPDTVYRAISRPTIGHLDPRFIEIMDALKDQLRTLFGTTNSLTFPVSGTGSAGMETCFVNLIEPGDSVLVLVNGVFGKRMADVAARLRAQVETLDFEWGTAVTIEGVRNQLSEGRYDIVAVVHAETSTGVANPVSEIGALVKDTGALFLVDTVTSLGGMPVEVAQWHADAVYSGTQKCLSCPPGLAPVTMSERSVSKIKNRKSKVPNWYLDLSMIMEYWEGAKRTYHHTAPINMIYALHQAAADVLDEGLEAVFARHRNAHETLVAGLAGMGIGLLVNESERLPMLNAVVCPDDVDEAAVRSRLLSEHLIEIGGGLGPLAGKIWRVGLMGHTARIENVERFLKALQEVL